MTDEERLKNLENGSVFSNDDINFLLVQARLYQECKRCNRFLGEDKERIQRIEKVMEFYADKQNYKRPKTDLREASMSEIMKDYGERARKELEGEE